MKRQTIGVDIDDVLSYSAEGFAEYSNKRWNLRLRPEDYTENWAEFWGIPVDVAVKRAEKTHSSGAFGQFRHFEPAVPVLTRLAKQYDLLVITSRRAMLKPETNEWLERYFCGLFKDVHYAGMWDSDADPLDMLQQTKAALCRELGVDYLIDDQPKHCIAAADVDIQALLFGDYSWNRAKKLSKKVTRVKDWHAVARYSNVEG